MSAMKTETTNLTNDEVLFLKTLLKTIYWCDGSDLLEKTAPKSVEQLADAMGYELDEYNELADGLFAKLREYKTIPEGAKL